MFQYRLVLSRLRRGDTDREIARSKSMGRRKLAALRTLAEQHGWLDPDAPLPDDAAIAAALGQPKRAATTVSGLQVLRPLLADWLEQGVAGTTIHAALKRNHGYQGSYSSVYRMIRSIVGEQPVGRVAHDVAEQRQLRQAHPVGILGRFPEPEVDPLTEVVGSEVVEPGGVDRMLQDVVGREVDGLGLAVPQGPALDVGQDRRGEIVDADVVHRSSLTGPGSRHRRRARSRS